MCSDHSLNFCDREAPVQSPAHHKNAHYDDLCSFDPKYDRCSPFETNCAQTGVDVVTSSTSLRKDFQSLTRSLDAVDVAKGNVVSRASSNIFIELKQIGLGTWAKS